MRRLLALAAGLVLAACSSTGPGQRVSLSFTTQSSTTTASSDVLVISKAQVVLRKVELEAREGACGQGPSASQADRAAQHETNPADHECEEFKAGPFLLDLPLNSIDLVVAVDVPPGTYREVEFEIHKLETGDGTLATSNPDFVGKSIRVEGTFNGQPFVFTTDLDVEQETVLEPPLVVTQQGITNLTVRVDFSTWFTTATGALIDPATANPGGVNRELVKQNIKRSFHAFEDEDRDGHEDHN